MKNSGPAAIQGFLSAYMMGMQMNEQRRARQDEMAYRRERARVEDQYQDRVISINEENAESTRKHRAGMLDIAREDAIFNREHSNRMFGHTVKQAELTNKRLDQQAEAQGNYYNDSLAEQKLTRRNAQEQFNAQTNLDRERMANEALWKNRELGIQEGRVEIAKQQLLDRQYLKRREAYAANISSIALQVQNKQLPPHVAFNRLQDMAYSASTYEDWMDIKQDIDTVVHNPNIFKFGKNETPQLKGKFTLDYNEEAGLKAIPAKEGYDDAYSTYLDDKNAWEQARLDVMGDESLDPFDKQKALIDIDTEQAKAVWRFRRFVETQSRQPKTVAADKPQTGQPPTGFLKKPQEQNNNIYRNSLSYRGY